MASWFRRAKAAYAAYTAPRADGAASRPITAEEAELHITPELLTYVTELVRMPQTWRQFPLVALLEEDGIDTAGLVLPSQKDPPGETDRLESPVPLLLTLAQVRHGECILARSPALSEFRMRLCPRYMDDDVFWKIYFLLVRRLVPLPHETDAGGATTGDMTALRDSEPVLWALVGDLDVLRAQVAEHALPQEGPLRAAVYERLLGTPNEEECAAQMRAAYDERFGVAAPADVLFPPRMNRFARTQDLVTNGPHRALALRVVACLQLQQRSAPQLPVVVDALLRLGWSEARTYCHAYALLGEGGVLSPSARAAGQQMLDALVQGAAPDVHHHLEALGTTASEMLRPSMHTLFHGRDQCVDRLLLCGWPAVALLGVALCQLLRTKLAQCFRAQLLPTVQGCERRHWAQVLPVARALSRNTVLPVLAPDSAHAMREDAEPCDYLRMRITHASAVLAPDSVGWELLHSWLPSRYQLAHTLRPVYTTQLHGTSLRTLYARSRASTASAFVLLVSTTTGSVFGAYLNCAPYPRADDVKKSYGTGECFLFQLAARGAPHFQRYVWNDAFYDTTFIETTNDGFSIGGNALFLDNELRCGVSRPSDTFGLAHALCDADAGQSDGTFECLHCELWHVVSGDA